MTEEGRSSAIKGISSEDEGVGARKLNRFKSKSIIPKVALLCMNTAWSTSM